MDRLDYYGCLKIDRDASQEQVKKAFRRMVRLSHPDLNPEDATASDRLQNVIAAYKVLGDPFSRARYDRVDTLFGPRRVSRDEVTERKSAYWEERLYQQSLRPRSSGRSRSDSRKPFVAGVLLLCLVLILVFYTFESDWFSSNPFQRTPKWRMPVEALKTNRSYTPVRAVRPQEDWGIPILDVRVQNEQTQRVSSH